jgi:UDP-N-acetylmuramyl pentapeptide synthase
MISQLDAKRKIYVTPGLVEQGIKTEVVHIELGKLIVQAKLDVVVLMQNSVCGFIRKSLEVNDFKGELRIESDPLNFYNNLQYEVAAGDLVLMQNDWTDNYA